MDKDLEKEYLEDLDHYDEGMGIHSTSYEKCKERLIRLAKIDQANSNEALEDLERLARFVNPSCEDGYDFARYEEDYNYIKQALIKSQEQEKVLEIIKNKEVDVKLFFNALFREQQYKINPLEFYNGTVGYKRLWLTQEEFDLLKRYFK